MNVNWKLGSKHKVVRIGTVKTWEGGRLISVYCAIEYNDHRLSIVGTEGPTQSGNAIGSSGQIVMHYRNDGRQEARQFVNFAPGWDKAKADKFFELWDKWHLNDMHAECEHQEAAGMTWATHPSNVCTVCGWQLGHAWSMREVPKDVIKWLFALPDTDKDPAWV